MGRQASCTVGSASRPQVSGIGRETPSQTSRCIGASACRAGKPMSLGAHTPTARRPSHEGARSRAGVPTQGLRSRPKSAHRGPSSARMRQTFKATVLGRPKVPRRFPKKTSKPLMTTRPQGCGLMRAAARRLGTTPRPSWPTPAALARTSSPTPWRPSSRGSASSSPRRGARGGPYSRDLRGFRRADRGAMPSL